VREVGDHVVRRRDEIDEILVERVTLDETECVNTVETFAQERRQASIELDRSDLRARSQQRARQQPEPGSDLEDPPARSWVRLGQDRVEDVCIGEEVLRQPVTGAEARGAKGRADGLRVDS